jgi:succinate-acetate transporter protein
MESQGSENLVNIKDTTSNPAPLGLLGFGMTTVLLNLHNAGIFELGSMILAMGIFYGGLAQVFAGWMEWKKGNTFGTTAFCSYGLFWLTFVALVVLPKLGIGILAPKPVAVIAYLVCWGVFTSVMYVGTLKINRALQVVFFTLALLFFLLAIGDWVKMVNGSTTITRIAGYEGIFCGASAIYTALAQVLNECYGKVVLPLCPVNK